MQGFVVLYNEAKGFGFIRNGAGVDWFFHKDQVIGDVQRADDVSFWLDDSRKRGSLVAVDVKRIILERRSEKS
jgi:cold shock CspA family protein